MSHNQTIVLIDDVTDIHNLVRAHLAPLDLRVVCCLDGDTGLAAIERELPDLILLDVNLNHETGFDICTQLKQNDRTTNIPVIFLTAAEDSSAKVRAFDVGAIDYVTKPFDPRELQARVRSVLRHQMLVNLLETQAQMDALTGLYNRKGFTDALQKRIYRGQREPKGLFAILFLDLNRFKIINDSLGHEVGDELLVHVAKILSKCVRKHRSTDRPQDVIARMGGDEFTILLNDVQSTQDAIAAAERLRKMIGEPVTIDGYKVTAEASIGVRVCKDGQGTPETLLRDSDIAMYEAKEAGEGSFMIFDDRMHQKVAHRMRLESDLQQALEAGQMEVFYQPITCLESGRVLSLEALMRWQHPELGFISPDQFIPILEETGLIMQYGRWVLEQSCRDLKKWRHDSQACESLKIGVNLSKRQLVEPSLIHELGTLLGACELEPKALILEVTESNIMFDEQRIIPVLHQLHELGVLVAMDDFGTGTSSLTALKRFPLDELKIDRSFIHCLEYSRSYAAIIQAIVVLAHNLNLSVVAEGVESSDQIAQLQMLECDQAQGFYLGRPLPAEEVEKAVLSTCSFAELNQNIPS
ncbi:EAL domain-containing protein [Planctomycetales bacterium ZRK34]|nr:EAL domain-containing protein [Planctomycetales bacterium ZRK34]